MSDTFFGKDNDVAQEDSAKAMPPMTHTNVSSENNLIEDSMNVALDDHKDPIYDEYNKLKYNYYKVIYYTKTFG